MGTMRQKVGIFAGTFDPLHDGHIAFAKVALRSCRLDRIVFIPEASPRGKTNVTPIATRIAQIASHVQSSPLYAIRQLATERFTISTTLPEITALYPGATYVLLIGSDVARHLAEWTNLSAVVEHFQFAIGMRDTETPEQVMAALQKAEQKAGRPIIYTLLTTPHAHLSSSHMRQSLSKLVASGRR